MTTTSTSQADPMAVRLTRAVMPLIDRPSVAVMAEVGVRYEAMVRRVLQAELNLAAAPFGVQTSATRRRIRERNQVRAMHPEVAAGTSGRNMPLVNWHEGGTGEPVLLINGWTASGLLWPSAWLAELERDHHVIRIDNRGTGWSRTAPAPYTVGDMADDAVAVLDALGIDSATVVGLSMGGMISQELAIRHPNRVNALILLATMPPRPEQVSPDPALLFTSLRGPGPGQGLSDYLRAMWSSFVAPEFLERDPAGFDELIDKITERITPRQRVIDQARAIGCWRGAGRLSRLTMPVTVLHGDQDPLLPVGNGRRLAQLIPGAEYVELAGAGHLLPYETGDAVLAAVASRV